MPPSRPALYLLVCAATACAGAPAPEPASGADAPATGSYRYRVRLDPDLGVLRVRVCFPDRVTSRLAPLDAEAADYLRWAATDDGRALARTGHRLVVGALPAGGCVQYAVDLSLAARTSRFVSRHGGSLLTSSAVWLWRPDPLPDRVAATLRFELPEGARVLTAWPAEEGVHRLDRSAMLWRAMVAFGALHIEHVAVPGGRLSYARLGPSDDPSDAVVRRWLEAAGRAVAGIEGRFPVPRAAIAVVPVGRGPDPVAFGMAERGGGASILLLLRRGADPDALVRDWVAVHELSHLLLPHLRREDAWMYEGLATYYQEVARARAGLMSPEAVWRDMLDGFARGDEAGTGRTLADESAAMHRTHAYGRVYWAGAAFMLEADVRLRAEHGLALEDVLARVTRAPSARTHTFTADELLRAMDAVAGTHLFTELASRMLASTQFPDVRPLLQRLGVVEEDGGVLTLRGDAPLADLRAAIMKPRSAAGADAAKTASRNGERGQRTRPRTSGRVAGPLRPTR